MKTVFVLGFLSLVLPVSVFACADAVQVAINIGELHIDDKTDSDFASLSNARFQEKLVSQPTSDGCLYSTAEEGPMAAVSVNAKLFLFVHETSSGEKIQINGYTEHGKLFEIRTTLAANAQMPAMPFSAGIYDASGPAKEMLGQASVLLRDE